MSGSTSTYPLDTVVEITDEIGGVEYQGSGVLIAPDEVLTASHVVYQTGEGLATDVVVTPDANRGTDPYGTADGTTIHYFTIDDSNDTISSADSQTDYAVIHLSQPFTNLGTMSLDAGFSGGSVTVSGYPASAGGVQVDSAQTVRQDPSYTLLDGRSLGAGSSGGPVWFTGANGVAELVGLVSSGAGRTGYDVQITAAVAQQIEAWVAQDDATPAPTPPAGYTNETLAGGAIGIITVAFPAATSVLAATLLAQLGADITASAMAPAQATQGQTPPAPPSGQVGLLAITATDAVALPASYGAVVDSAAGPVTVALTSGANVSVVAGSGWLTLSVGQTSGTLVGAGGNTLFYAGTASGAWDVALGAGVNTILAGGGADSIAAGAGENLMFLGTGADLVNSTGTDTIVGGGGAATISATANALVFGGAGSLTFLAGSSAATVVGAAGGTSVRGGAGPLLYFGTGPSTYIGATGSDTVLGGTGAMTAIGGGGTDLIVGGAAGGNMLTSGSGPATLFGGGSGDALNAIGGASDILVAASGTETLNAGASSGNNSFFAGSGNDVMVGGAGATAMIGGTGNATLTGGSGTTLFGFIDGRGGGTDLITNFDPSRDEIVLRGYGANAATDALRTAVVSTGSTTLTLADNTRIIFSGIVQLAAASFG